MAVIFMDGFDYYQTADIARKWSSGGGQATISAAYARSLSGQGVSISGGNVDALVKSFGSNRAGAGVVGFAWQASTVTGKILIGIMDGTTEQFTIRTNASSVLTVNQGATVKAIGSTVLAINTWYYVECKFTVHGSAGVAEVKLNGAAEIASTGSLDLTGTANNYWNGIRLGVKNDPSASGLFDDLYLIDAATGSNTDFLGPVIIAARAVAGNGNSAQWTPNGGSNSGSVSDLFSDGDISFNASATADQVDTFVLQDLPAAAGSVFAVGVHSIARQDAGAARSIAPVIRISGTDYVGATVNLSTSYLDYGQIYDHQPVGGTPAWDVSTVNGLESGYKLIA